MQQGTEDSEKVKKGQTWSLPPQSLGSGLPGKAWLQTTEHEVRWLSSQS